MDQSAVHIILTVLAVAAAVWAVLEAAGIRTVHKRLNDLYGRVKRHEETPHASGRAIAEQFDEIQNELFREGSYPDLGLREWCRVWRGRLRDDVAELKEQNVKLLSRVTTLEARVQFLENSNPDLQTVVATPFPSGWADTLDVGTDPVKKSKRKGPFGSPDHLAAANTVIYKGKVVKSRG